jgi:transposase-like protein
MQCPLQLNTVSQVSLSGFGTSAHATIRSGSFLRHSDHVRVQRFFCKTCKKSFSSESKSPLKYQKKRHLNDFFFALFASGMSQRRAARLLTVNKKTVVRKFLFLGEACVQDLLLRKHLPKRDIGNFTFDEMETFEHTKMKPLSIALAVEDKTRLILDFKVSSMKAKGLLAERSRKKYGPRKDERKKNLKALLQNLKTLSPKPRTIKSDMCPHYPLPVKQTFPDSEHQVFKGKRGCVVGQGELKAVGFDPLFSLNHTAAMLRANINRLFRRTWNTTKKPECLTYHIAIYVFYHNLRLLKDIDPPLNNS